MSDSLTQRGNILLIEDSDILGELLTRLLEAEGYCVTLETTAQRAHDLIVQQHEAYDLIIFDLNLAEAAPDLSLEKLQTTQLPLIVLVSSERRAEVEKLHQIHEQNLIWKPFSPRHLVQVVGQHLRPDARTGGSL